MGGFQLIRHRYFSEINHDGGPYSFKIEKNVTEVKINNNTKNIEKTAYNVSTLIAKLLDRRLHFQIQTPLNQNSMGIP